jgi:serine/threonine protein kinase
LDFIAQGGMGAVYLAKQISLDREVAVKILPRELSADPEFRASFQTEARAMARLNHPNLISIYDSGDVDGMLYIAMEYVPGKSLYHSAWNKKIDPVEASRIIIGICEGLSHAHENGIIHRDIKPANILLTPKAEPKIGDFGLAQAVGVKHEGVVMGTPGYAAPEVISQPNKADRRSDLFAVGVMLHELLTGQKPEPGITASSLCQCPTDFDVIIQRATHLSPLMRYPDASSMANAIRAALESKPQVKTHPRIAVAPPRTTGQRSIFPQQTAGSSPTLLTSTDKQDGRIPTHAAPSTTVVAQSRKAKSSVVRNLFIIAALLFVVVVLYQQLEIDQGNATQQKTLPLADNRLNDPAQQQTQTSIPPSNNNTDSSFNPSQNTTTRSETPQESLRRLKDLLAEGSREELPLSSVRRGDTDYFYVNTPMSWDSAQQFAEEHGGYIAFPRNEDDLTFLGSLIKDNQSIWLGAGRSDRDEWTLLSGENWPLSKTPPGIGAIATLSHLGNVRAAEATRVHHCIIAWNRDGSNPFTLSRILQSTRKSIEIGKARYPAGTHHVGNRHFLPILRQLSLTQAQELAQSAGAHIAALSNREENYWLKDHLSQAHAPKGIILGGQKINDIWQWCTQEPWIYADWAADHPSSSTNAIQLAYLPKQGWIDVLPSEPCDGVLLEWSRDANLTEQKKPTNPSSLPNVASLVTRCRELLAASTKERDEAMSKNVKAFQWELDVWSRNLKSLERNRWSNAVDLLQSLAQENNKIPSAAKFTRILEEENELIEGNTFRQRNRKDDADEKDDIRDKRKTRRQFFNDDEEEDSDGEEIDLVSIPPGIIKIHHFALSKQLEILQACRLRNTKIRDAYAGKIREMGAAAQQAGQADLVRQLRDYFDATTDLDSWVESMLDPT